MNWDVIGATGEWAGAFVVVATVIYLSRQIRESNKHAKAESERELQMSWDEKVVGAALHDAHLRTVARKGYESFESLSDDEKAVFMMLMTQVANHLELVLRMERDGLLSADIAETYRGNCLAILGTPGGREYWKMGNGLYQELSTDYLNQNLESSKVIPLTEALPFWIMKEDDN